MSKNFKLNFNQLLKSLKRKQEDIKQNLKLSKITKTSKLCKMSLLNILMITKNLLILR